MSTSTPRRLLSGQHSYCASSTEVPEDAAPILYKLWNDNDLQHKVDPGQLARSLHRLPLHSAKFDKLVS